MTLPFSILEIRRESAQLSCVIYGMPLYRAVRQCHNGRTGGGVRDSTHSSADWWDIYFPWHRHQIEGTDGF